jgi:ataxin-3
MIQNIYWERQQGDSLCGVHCLNSLLQRPQFTAFNLCTVAETMHERERQVMAAGPGGTSSDEYIAFLAADSQHVDNSGNFSALVMFEALQKRGLDAFRVTDNTGIEEEQAFFVNRASHWFAIRKLGGSWFNLNSLSETGPEYISDFFLSAFLQQLKMDGYSLFCVQGDFPAPLDKVRLLKGMLFLMLCWLSPLFLTGVVRWQQRCVGMVFMLC